MSLQASGNVPAPFADGLSEILAILLRFSPVPLLGLVAWRGLLQGVIAFGQCSQVLRACARGPCARSNLFTLKVPVNQFLVLTLQALHYGICLLVTGAVRSSQGLWAQQAAPCLASESSAHRHDAASTFVNYNFLFYNIIV